MRWARIAILFLFLALLQSTLMSGLAVGAARPDLVFALAVIIVSRRPAEFDAWEARAFWIGWMAGLAVDLFQPGGAIPFGLTALVYGLAVWGASELAAGLMIEKLGGQIFFLIPCCLAVQTTMAVALSVAGPGPAGPLVRQVIGVTAYTATVSPVLFYIVTRCESFFGVRARREFDV